MFVFGEISAFLLQSDRLDFLKLGGFEMEEGFCFFEREELYEAKKTERMESGRFYHSIFDYFFITKEGIHNYVSAEKNGYLVVSEGSRGVFLREVERDYTLTDKGKEEIIAVAVFCCYSYSSLEHYINYSIFFRKSDRYDLFRKVERKLKEMKISCYSKHFDSKEELFIPF